jgi:hypothetical protein
MARTKTKPGTKPKYGARELLHVLIPTGNLTDKQQGEKSMSPFTREQLLELLQSNTSLARSRL